MLARKSKHKFTLFKGKQNMYLKIFISSILLFLFNGSNFLKDSVDQNVFGNEWILCEVYRLEHEGVRVVGDPQVITCEYGEAILFNGKTDGIFLNAMPLSDLYRFTVEALVRPDSGGSFEQRFLHCGEVQGDRLLLEIRTSPTDWYFDAYIKSGEQQKALIDKDLLHPLNQWYHVAFVVDQGKQTTYINGKEELSSKLNYAPLHEGISSLGVRQNEKSWFKGAIYKIKFSPKALNPKEFMNY